jgi:pSer/pThr/pTyr-binding forkhead associated (FHA) protein
VDGQQFSVEKEVFHIGAHPHNDLPIVNDEYVSGEHAYLRYEQGSFFLFDKGSRNGTFVNQQAVPETGLALGVGDQIQVGRSTFEVRRGTS